MSIDLLSAFLDYQMACNHAATTIIWYRGEIERFHRWREGRPFDAPATITAYLAASRQKPDGRPASPFTVAGHYRALRSWFAWLVAAEHLPVNPMAKIPKPKTPRRQPRRASLAEYAMLMDAIGHDSWIDARDRCIVAILFLCGLRRSECARLEVADVRTNLHQLFVHQGKGGHDRNVPLLPAVERAFVEYLFVRPDCAGPLLVAADNHCRAIERGLSGQAIYEMLRRRCKRAGLRLLNPHSFRHGLAMYLLNDTGADMSLVQKILGHSQISTTARFYAEWLDDGVLREYSYRMKDVATR